MNDFDLYGLWSMRELFSNAKNFMYGTLESSTYHYQNMASSCLMRDFSSTNTWQPRSLLQNKDIALSSGMDKAEQSVLPFTFEGRRLDENTPRADVMRSRGRVFGEQAITLGGLFSVRNIGKGLMETGKELLQSRRLQVPQWFSREYLFSGKSSSTIMKSKEGVSLSKPNLTPKNFFGNKTYDEMKTLLTNKFGPPRGKGAYNESFFNKNTGRTFNLHCDPLHKGGKPHIDIRKRGLDTNYYKERPFFLLGE